MAMHDLV